jgi:hypothetical protein
VEEEGGETPVEDTEGAWMGGKMWASGPSGGLGNVGDAGHRVRYADMGKYKMRMCRL